MNHCDTCRTHAQATDTQGIAAHVSTPTHQPDTRTISDPPHDTDEYAVDETTAGKH